ncbi:MAG: PAS domain-containing sensor histidine kinase, partial [Methylocystis sp.]|nr:PAS domain-containing sensor histidine kinase [Methylocystis sp.]
MARADAADAASYAETVWSSVSSPASGAPGAAAGGAWSQRFALAACVFCIVILIAFMITLTNKAHDQVVEDATADLEIFANAVWHDVRAAIRDEATATLAPVLPQIVPGHALARGRRILVADQNGRVTAALPPLGEGPATLSGILGTEQILTEFADKAGVMRITLGDGTPALAIVRNLPTPLG